MAMASATATIRSDYFHPQHMLAAYHYSNASTHTCDACELAVTGAGYRCDECNFHIHKACFTRPLPGSLSLGGEAHDPNWALTRLDSTRPCFLCEETSDAGRYMYMSRASDGIVCVHPRCVLTSSAAYFHPEHSLGLYIYDTGSTKKCDACELGMTDLIGYRCGL
ncbi:unnamed protein product [Urochloa humidicola]